MVFVKIIYLRFFKKGETATLEVVPSEGCQFDAWSDGSTQTRRTIKVEENDRATKVRLMKVKDMVLKDAHEFED